MEHEEELMTFADYLASKKPVGKFGMVQIKRFQPDVPQVKLPHWSLPLGILIALILFFAVKY